jgi:hypothetical protein
MSRKKLKVDDRRWLKKAGFRREHGGLAGLACALREAETGPRPAGYVLQADSSWGERTRRRVVRNRRRRVWMVLRYVLLMVALYGGSLAVVLLLVAAVWDWVVRFLLTL